ncbi:MAG: CRISPR-associated endonuclease Cas2 [Bacteroidales bacterium]|nr:CRISPR-associated endonuclease Cas2 [Bacteroidales bacterium]
MIIVCYDISDNSLRTSFSKMLTRHGAIRVQYSVYEANNTKRWIDTLKSIVEREYSKLFEPTDSVIIFETDSHKELKYGKEIYRDKEIVFL